MAIYRILLPKAQIPSLCALKYYPGVGQLEGLNAGANDVLIHTATPESIASNFALFSKDKKYVALQEALEVIKQAGLRFDPLGEVPLLYRGKV